MEIKTLNGISTKDIQSVFNESFSDYFIPFHLSEEQLTSKMLADKVNLDLSVGVFDNGLPIAFILHGFDIVNDEKVIYNGGTGVVPNKRGLGLTHKMYEFILPLLKEKGVKSVQLEVISENLQAIKSYQKSGFKIERELFCYKGDITIPTANDEVLIKKLKEYDWNIMESFWDIQPTWQNSKNVVNELITSNISLGAFSNDQLVGYVLFSPHNKRIQQIAVDKNFRQLKIASTLLQALIPEHGKAISIINVDKSATSVHAFLQEIGFKKHVGQLEMKLMLN